MGMPPPVLTDHCCAVTWGEEVIRGREFCLGRGGVCVASGIGIKTKIPWEGLPEKKITRESGGLREGLSGGP